MVTKPQPAISVVVPAYNEESRLPATLARLSAFLKKKKKPYEIIVVDDGSKDNTSAVALQASRRDPSIRLIDNVFNLGKGASVRNGVMEARAEAILFTDADLSTPIEELDQLWPRLSQADLVLGSRALAGSHIRKRQPLYRVLMGKTFNFFVRLLAVRGIHDTQCGFKLMTRALGQRIFPLQRVPRFGFDVEMIYLARKFGYRIQEVPVAWENSLQSTVNPVSDASQMFFDLLQIRLNDWQGKYRESEVGARN